MGCCSGKSSCEKRQEHLNMFAPNTATLGVDILGKLNEIIAAGINAGKIFRNMLIKNDAWEQLAKQITDLTIENAYMKSVFNLVAPLDTNVADSAFTLNFGPQHTYSIRIPVTTKHSRAELAKQLRFAADQLEAETKTTKSESDLDQKFLPFCE